jgi:biopolymer transport protein ExbD
MKNSRRMMRLSRFRSKVTGINLTSLMDVFTILVFFLVMNSGSEVLDAGDLALPESVIDTKPTETVVINVGTEDILVQGEPVARVADIIAAGGGDIVPIMTRLAELQDSVIGARTQVVAESMAITILADKSIPFSVVKQVMSTCTSQGYTRISLAVIQKESAVASAAAPVSAGTGI